MTKRVGIVGAGAIGGGWVARHILNGCDVALYDPDPVAIERAREALQAARFFFPMLFEQGLPEEGRLVLCESMADALSGAECVFQCIAGNLDTRRAVLSEIQELSEDGALVLVSLEENDAFLATDHIGEFENVIAIRPSDPVYLYPLVEVIGRRVGGPIAARASTMLRDLGMEPVSFADLNAGQIAARLKASVLQEAALLVEEGRAKASEIEQVLSTGMSDLCVMPGFWNERAGSDLGHASAFRDAEAVDAGEVSDRLCEIGGQRNTQRDEVVVAVLRALKARDYGAGKVLLRQDARLAAPKPDGPPFTSVERTVPSDWTDYNGHMNEARYGQVFSDAADGVMKQVGADADYIAGGLSYFTVETTIKYLNETHSGEAFFVDSKVTLGAGKKLRLFHKMRRSSDEALLATCDQFLLHVDLGTRRSCEPTPEVSARVTQMQKRHRSDPST